MTWIIILFAVYMSGLFVVGRVDTAAMRAEWWQGFELAGRVLDAGGLDAAPRHRLPPALAALHRDGGLLSACEEAARVVRVPPPPTGLVAYDARERHAQSLVQARRVPSRADAFVLIGFAEGLVAPEA